MPTFESGHKGDVLSIPVDGECVVEAGESLVVEEHLQQHAVVVKVFRYTFSAQVLHYTLWGVAEQTTVFVVCNANRRNSYTLLGLFVYCEELLS